MRALSYTMHRRSAVDDAVAGANSPGEPLFCGSAVFAVRAQAPTPQRFGLGLVASDETPWALTLAQPDVRSALARRNIAASRN